jgi:hypothetical protein
MMSSHDMFCLHCAFVILRTLMLPHRGNFQQKMIGAAAERAGTDGFARHIVRDAEPAQFSKPTTSCSNYGE